MQVFESAPHARIKPLQKQLNIAIEHLTRGIQTTGNPESIAKQFVSDVRDLYVQTYEIMSVLVNQFRATLRVKLISGMPPPEQTDVDKLQQALAEYAQALRKMIAARKKGDDEAAKMASGQMERAAEVLKQAHPG